MKKPKYNMIDFMEAKGQLTILRNFYIVANTRLYCHLDQDAIKVIIKSIDCAIAALDYCIEKCVLIEEDNNHDN